MHLHRMLAFHVQLIESVNTLPCSLFVQSYHCSVPGEGHWGSKTTEAAAKPLPLESLARMGPSATPWRPTKPGKQEHLSGIHHINL